METPGSMMGRTGWELVETQMERQIEAGLTTAEHYRRHFAGEDGSDPTMESWLHYQEWREGHPGAAVPASIRRVRTNEAHRRWSGGEEGGSDER